MASTDRTGLKRAALLGFLLVCIGLIGMIWVDNLTGGPAATPSYYRDTYKVDEDIYLTVTAEALEFQRTLSGTPAPEAPGEHNGPGQGQGRGRSQSAATPEGAGEQGTAVP